MEDGQPEQAVGFCERAIQANPHDAGLRANLALALLFSNRPQEALAGNPADAITQRIAGIIGEVLSGARTCPRHTRDLK